MGAIRGVECKVYLNTGTYEAPTWAEFLCVKDTTISLDFGEVDATCRGGGGTKQSAVTLTSLEVSGGAIKEKLDPTFLAMEAAAWAKTVVDVLVLDGPRLSADSDGYRFDGQLFTWNENQPIEDIVTVDFTLKPARSLNATAPVSGPQASSGDT